MYYAASPYLGDISTGGSDGGTFTVLGGSTPNSSHNYIWTPNATDAAWLLLETDAGSVGYSLGGTLYLDYFDMRWFLRESEGGTLITGTTSSPETLAYADTTTNYIVQE